MKRFTQFICVLLVVILTVPTVAYASEDTMQRASNFFAADSCYLYQTSGTEFEVWFEVTGVEIMDEIGASTVKVQRSSDGTNWTTVKTYTKDSYSEMIDKNSTAHNCCFTYTGSEGYYYRAYVVFYAKLGTGTGTLGRYTSKIKL